MNLTSTLTRRAGILAMGLMLVATSAIGAQDATPVPYEAPDGLGDISGSVSVAGSSTVAPITEGMIETFAGVASGIQVSNETTGTGGGFELFCAGETQIQNASRPITAEEVEACAASEVGYYELTIALDGLAIVTSTENEFLDCLTVEQIVQVWQVDSEVTTWDQVDPEFPAEPVDLFGPDPDSGTYDYMAEVVEDTAGVEGLRDDYTQSVDDNVLVEGVTGSSSSLGYFGYAYYEQNSDSVKAVAVDAGDGCVEASLDTVVSGEYTPFARELYIYVDAEALASDAATQEFTRFYLANTSDISVQVGYFPAPVETIVAEQALVDAAIAGEATPDSDVSATPAA